MTVDKLIVRQLRIKATSSEIDLTKDSNSESPTRLLNNISKKFENILKMKNKKSNTKKQTKKATSPKHLSTKSDCLSDFCNNDSHEKALNKVQWYEERNKILDKRNLELTKENLGLKIGLAEVSIELEFYKIHAKSCESDKVEQLIQQNERLAGEKVCLQGTNDAWVLYVEDMKNHFKHNEKTMKSKILALEHQIKELKAKASKEASQIPALQTELKLENAQKRTLEAKIKRLDNQLKQPKVDECSICFEEISVNRKWAAFVPCGHRVCSDCADKFSNKTSTPRWPTPQNTNRQKCPHCRQNINSFLVLEGIYGS